MDTKQFRFSLRKAVLLGTLLFSALSPVWSDVRLDVPAPQDGKKVCYCGCDSKPGSPACHMMCDLPKYQGSWWAKNCAAKPAQKLRSAAPAHHSSKKNNKVQAASL